MTSEEGAGAPRGRLRVALRWAGRVALAIALALATAEVALQLAARSGSDREGSAGGDRPHRILCAGDSHTYGAGVPDADSYPAQLREILEQRAPGQFGVVNVGVPGMNTTQVLNRLPEYVSRFRPETLIVWAGVNNSWNTSEIHRPHGSWLAYLEGLASASRVFRFGQVLLHDLRLKREATPAGDPGQLRFKTDTSESHKLDVTKVSPNRTVTVHWEGGTETLQFEGTTGPPDPAAAERAEQDFEAMATFAEAAGVRLVFVTYPIKLQGFEFASEAMRRVGARHGLTVIDSSAAMDRVPKDKLEFVALFHPTRPLYGEIARDIADQLAPATATSAN